MSFAKRAKLKIYLMYSEDDLQYALENTKVIVSPERRIETFGATSFHFYLVTELMDSANEMRIRDGRIQADRPQILTAENIAKLTLGRVWREGAEVCRDAAIAQCRVAEVWISNPERRFIREFGA